MLPPLPRPAVAVLTFGLLTTASLHAQQPAPDAPPIDVNQMLKSLSALHGQETTGVKSLKQTAYQQIATAASSVDGAINLWTDAIRATQMDGAGKENASFRTWKDTDGEVFKEREVQEAVVINLQWLALTLQRANGTEVKDMLPAIINFTSTLLAHQAVVEALEQRIKTESEQTKSLTGPKRETSEKTLRSDQNIKRTQDSILNQDVGSSVVSQSLKLGGYLEIEGWVQRPSDFDGIYDNIVQPELRSELSQRVFDYWDAKLRTEADRATRTKLNYEVDKFNTLRRPELLWGRAMEFAYLGQKNRAATEMFNVIKTYPTHPDAAQWIEDLQKFIAPPASGTAASPGTAGATATPAAAAAPPAK
jgi:hypothetical protein